MAHFGVLISNRSFFPDHLVITAREKLLASLTAWGHTYVTLSTEDTFMGETMSYDEAKKCAALFKAHADQIATLRERSLQAGQKLDWDERGAILTLLGSAERVLGLVQRIDDERRSVSRELRSDSVTASRLPPSLAANPV